MTATAHELALAPEPRLYDIPDLCRILRMSRSLLYEQIRSGRLRTVKQGRSRRASDNAVREYIALLEKEAETGR
jgi:excisionase family DNA binding protein